MDDNTLPSSKENCGDTMRVSAHGNLDFGEGKLRMCGQTMDDGEDDGLLGKVVNLRRHDGDFEGKSYFGCVSV